MIYGGDRGRRDDRYRGRDNDRQNRGRAIPRDSYPYPNARRGAVNGGVPFDNGYTDGYDKGREDVRANRSYDPVRHSRYRSADRGYNERYGTREAYKHVYRDGFEAGYDAGFRDARASGDERRGIRFPWPF